MASEADHIALANKNHLALKYLMEKPAQFPEWIATVAFYKAIHVVEASFAYTQVGTTDKHNDRKDKLKRGNRHYKHVFEHYRALWEASTIARYMMDLQRGSASFTTTFPPGTVIRELVEHRLREIETNLCAPGANPRLLSEEAIRNLERV